MGCTSAVKTDPSEGCYPMSVQAARHPRFCKSQVLSALETHKTKISEHICI